MLIINYVDISVDDISNANFILINDISAQF